MGGNQVASEFTVYNISEYIMPICQLNNEIRKYNLFHKKELLFRGQSNKNYELIPAIGRGRNFACDCTIFNEERNLIDMAKFKMPNIFHRDLSPVELLSLLQHYGIPTRLLDITENALVALYFACNKNEDEDGEVIVFEHDFRHVTNYPIINAIADSYRFTNGTWTSLSTFFGHVKNQPYFLEQKQENEVLFATNEDGGQWIARCCSQILYIYAPIQSTRQQAQQGRYILFSNRINLEDKEDKNEITNCFEWMIDPIPKNHDDIVMRIIIPKEQKKQLLYDLSILGIDESVLFCDNVDTVCKGIVDLFEQKYTP